MPPGFAVSLTRSRSGSGLAGCLDPLEPPDDDVLALGHVQERLSLELEPVRRHGVQLELRFGGPDAPRRVMNLGAVQAGPVGGVEAVALRQEVLDASRQRRERLPRPARTGPWRGR